MQDLKRMLQDIHAEVALTRRYIKRDKLEDAVLAARSQAGSFTVNDLLLYSAVCGTGLDTVPLPGDVSEEDAVDCSKNAGQMQDRIDSHKRGLDASKLGEDDEDRVVLRTT